VLSRPAWWYWPPIALWTTHFYIRYLLCQRRSPFVGSTSVFGTGRGLYIVGARGGAPWTRVFFIGCGTWDSNHECSTGCRSWALPRRRTTRQIPDGLMERYRRAQSVVVGGVHSIARPASHPCTMAIPGGARLASGRRGSCLPPSAVRAAADTALRARVPP